MGYLTEDEISELLEVGELIVDLMNDRAAGLDRNDYKEAAKLMSKMFLKLERDNYEMRKTLQKIQSMTTHQIDEVDNTR